MFYTNIYICHYLVVNMEEHCGEGRTGHGKMWTEADYEKARTKYAPSHRTHSPSRWIRKNVSAVPTSIGISLLFGAVAVATGLLWKDYTEKYTGAVPSSSRPPIYQNALSVQQNNVQPRPIISSPVKPVNVKDVTSRTNANFEQPLYSKEIPKEKDIPVTRELNIEKKFGNFNSPQEQYFISQSLPIDLSQADAAYRFNGQNRTRTSPLTLNSISFPGN